MGLKELPTVTSPPTPVPLLPQTGVIVPPPQTAPPPQTVPPPQRVNVEPQVSDSTDKGPPAGAGFSKARPSVPTDSPPPAPQVSKQQPVDLASSVGGSPLLVPQYQKPQSADSASSVGLRPGQTRSSDTGSSTDGGYKHTLSSGSWQRVGESVQRQKSSWNEDGTSNPGDSKDKNHQGKHGKGKSPDWGKTNWWDNNSNWESKADSKGKGKTNWNTREHLLPNQALQNPQRLHPTIQITKEYRKNIPCRDYFGIKRYCAKGDGCTFSHEQSGDDRDRAWAAVEAASPPPQWSGSTNDHFSVQPQVPVASPEGPEGAVMSALLVPQTKPPLPPTVLDEHLPQDDRKQVIIEDDKNPAFVVDDSTVRPDHDAW